jgi:cytochrome c oxidase subunit 2
VSQPGAGSLDPQGPVAEAMADLWWLMLGLGVAVFLAVALLLAVALARRRSAAEPRAEREASNRFGRWLVVGGVVLPLIILVVVFGATVQAMRFVPAEAPSDALVVEIVGHQWWWEVHYPEQGVTTANEVHIPVGRQVALQLTSADVIHSFWVPSLAGKMDLLPDGTNTLVLQADELGEHRSQCAEFCGLQHTNHGLVVVAEPEEAFASWVAGQQEPAVEPADAAAQRGQDVFLGANCVDCHAIRGTTADATDGPDLTHVASRASLGAGTLPNTPQDLAAWVANPHTSKSGVEMPAAELADEELDALLAYLESLE